MKFAKLGFKTKEGLSLANFQDGWSMEWGEGGSYHCDLLYNGKKVCELCEEGNGGPIRTYNLTDRATMKKVEKAILDYLVRTNEDYGPNTKYKFCLEAVENGKATDCEYSTLAEGLIDEYEKRKNFAKYIKKGYKLVGIFDLGWTNTIVATCGDENHLREYAKLNNIKGNLTCYTREQAQDYLDNKII